MKAPGRRQAIGALLLLTLLLSLWLAQQPQPDAEVVAAAPVRPGPAATAPERSARLSSTHSPAPAGRTAWPELSAAALAAWSPPVAPPAPPAPRAAPPSAKAPPFPYQWIGQLDDGETLQALLSSPQRSFGVRAGDVLESRWRIERVGSRSLQVTWLPTGDLVDVTAR